MESSGTRSELRKSCDLCCSRKRRCDGDGVNPCTLCASKGQACIYRQKERRGPKPKPKPKRNREDLTPQEIEAMRSAGFVGTVSAGPFGDPSHAVVVERTLAKSSGGDEIGGQAWQQGSPPPPKTARLSDIVRLSPSVATGMLGLAENQHLNCFFSGFGTCTQIVLEDEVRGAMIHILSGGQLGMSSGSSGGFSDRSSRSGSGGEWNDRDGAEDNMSLISLRGVGDGMGWEDVSGNEMSDLMDARERGKRARLAANVASLWAGIGVGAMISGQMPKDVRQYVENAQDAIKGCQGCLSEEVLRANLMLAQMYSFLEDFPAFFKYTEKANAVAAELERQGEEVPATWGGDTRDGVTKGCSAPAKFLLKIFAALEQFLELEGREDSLLMQRGATASTQSEVRGKSQSVASSLGSSNAEAYAALYQRPGANGQYSRSQTCGNQHEQGSEELGQPLGVHASRSSSGRQGSDLAGMNMDQDIRRDSSGMEEDSNETMHPLTLMSVSSTVSGKGGTGTGGPDEEEIPGLASAGRVQACLSVLVENSVVSHLKKFGVCLERLDGGKDEHASTEDSEDENLADPDDIWSSERKRGDMSQGSDGDRDRYSALEVNQVLFVGDTRILEVAMGVDCACITIMCKTVAGAPWSDIIAEATMVARAAEVILNTVLSSPTVSRSICAVKLLSDAAFANLCLGQAEKALKAVEQFCSILEEFPGLLRFPPWRHCFHWMAGMLESAALPKLYEILKDGLNGLGLVRLQRLPEYGSAHKIMCDCRHFRCQATHRALAECARQDPNGNFRVPESCPRYGTGATGSKPLRTTTNWAAQLKAAQTLMRNANTAIVGGGKGKHKEQTMPTATPAPRPTPTPANGSAERTVNVAATRSEHAGMHIQGGGISGGQSGSSSLSGMSTSAAQESSRSAGTIPSPKQKEVTDWRSKRSVDPNQQHQRPQEIVSESSFDAFSRTRQSSLGIGLEASAGLSEADIMGGGSNSTVIGSSSSSSHPESFPFFNHPLVGETSSGMTDATQPYDGRSDTSGRWDSGRTSFTRSFSLTSPGISNLGGDATHFSMGNSYGASSFAGAVTPAPAEVQMSAMPSAVNSNYGSFGNAIVTSSPAGATPTDESLRQPKAMLWESETFQDRDMEVEANGIGDANIEELMAIIAEEPFDGLTDES